MSTPQERLQSGYYNSAAVSGANPGGLASGGHVPNFPAALQDIGAVSQDVGAKSAGAINAAASATAAAQQTAADRIAVQQAAAGQLAWGNIAGKPPVAVQGDVTRFAAVLLGTGNAMVYADAGLDRVVVKTGPATAERYVVFETDGSINTLSGAIKRQGNPVWDQGNDGAGSGLDADLVRGQVPSVGAAANSLAARNGDGSSGFKAVYLAPGGQVFFEGISAGFYEYDASTLGFGKAIYVGQGVSASELRQRSDRRLKQDIQPLEAGGRLAPVRFVLKESGEEHIGFIAQDVAEVRREAVRIGGGEGEQPMLEVSPMALIAHLAAQVNALQDRLDAAGL